MIIHMLRAHNGDAFIIRHKDSEEKFYNFIIDGGTTGSYKGELKRLFETVNNKGIDAVFLTHADDDHIGGILKFFSQAQDLKVRMVYYNSPWLLANEFDKEKIRENKLMIDMSDVNHSYGHAVSFEDILCKKGINKNAQLIYDGVPNIKIGNIELEILSPTMEQLKKLCDQWEREKYSEIDNVGKQSDHKKKIRELWDKAEIVENTIANDSSIAFLLKYRKDTILFMGDANPETIRKALVKRGYSIDNKIRLSFMKLSHHGSKHNITAELLKLIICNKYLISTNGTRFGHPDKETLAKIIKNRINSDKIYFYFNYEYGDIITKEEMKEYNVFCEVKKTFNISGNGVDQDE